MAAGVTLSDITAWLAGQTGGAPAVLRDRVFTYVGAAQGDDMPAMLVHAALRALQAVDGRDGNRSAALDLLAADALITLALLAKAEQDPARLHDFAGALLTPGRASA